MAGFESDMRVRIGRWVLVAIFLLGGGGAKAAVFFNDLSAANGGSETASGVNWLTATFTTDSSAYTQLSATLLLGNPTAGSAELDLYSDGGLQPGSPLAVLSSPASYTSALSNTTFSQSGLSLASNTTYWLVLKANSGSFNWGWTSDSSIFEGWGNSFDAGASWFTDDAFPLQFSVTGSVPEPGCVGMIFVAVSALGMRRRRR